MESQINNNQIVIKPTLPKCYVPIGFGIILFIAIISVIESHNFIVYIYSIFMASVIYMCIRHIYKNTVFSISKNFIKCTKDYIFFKTNNQIKASEIREILISQNILQRHFGLGSIILKSKLTNNGDIFMTDILNHEKVAEDIKLIIRI